MWVICPRSWDSGSRALLPSSPCPHFHVPPVVLTTPCPDSVSSSRIFCKPALLSAHPLQALAGTPAPHSTYRRRLEECQVWLTTVPSSLREEQLCGGCSLCGLAKRCMSQGALRKSVNPLLTLHPLVQAAWAPPMALWKFSGD